MILIELLLTLAAYRRGWRAAALLPMAVTFGIAFLMGAAVQASGGNVNDALPVAALLEIALVVVLGFMAARAPRPQAAAPVRVAVPGPAPTLRPAAAVDPRRASRA